MADNLSFNIRLDASGDGPVVLPNNETAANAQFTRSGADLYLREPDGQAIKVEGYFSHSTPPDLVSSDGARLSHAMVDSFLIPAQPLQYAANAAASDASPVGKVTEVVGDATITHTDGTHAKIDAGMAVHMGDIIETSGKGAVHILFADDTTFAISHNARLAIDNYTYDPQTHTGTSFFSMLHGVFVYTSGLIGKSDPGDVNIHTPVGSIGIRGTVIAGDINTAGQPSTVTVVDGAIVVSNDGGTLTMNSSLDTATLTSYSTAPTETGVMSTQSFDTAYSSVAPVDPAFSSLTGGTTSAPTTTAPDTTSPATTAPDTMTQATPGDTVGTTVTVTGTSTVNITDPYDPTITDPTVALTSSTVTSPTSATTFTSDTTTFGTTATGTTSFTGTTATFGGAPATSGSLSTTGSTTTSGTSATTSFTTSPTLSTTSGSGAGGSGITVVGLPAAAQFAFSNPYLNGTTSTTDDGIPIFGQQVASLFSTQTWGSPGSAITLGTVQTQGITSPTFALSGTGLAFNSVTLQYDLTGNIVVPDPTGGSYTTTPGVIAHFTVSSTGVVSMTLADPTGLSYFPGIQPGGNFGSFTVTATDGTTSTSASQSFALTFQPVVPSGAVLHIGGEAGAGTLDNFSLTGTNNVIFERNGVLGNGASAQFIGTISGEHDVVILGTTGGDNVIWVGQGTAQLYGNGGSNETMEMTNPNFLTDGVSLVNGGSGTNQTLELGSLGASGQTYNFLGTSNVTNIENLTIAAAPNAVTPNATVTLDMQNVFDMSNANDPAHTVTISTQATNYGTTLNLYLNNPTTNASELVSGSVSDVTIGQQETIKGTLVSNGQTVTLIIDHGVTAPTPTSGISLVLH